MFPLVDNFEVDTKYKERPHERHEFKLVIDGKKYKGDYKNGEIHWLNPHPKQVVSESELKSVEDEVYELLGDYGVRDDTDNIEIESLENNQSRNMHMFKLKIQGEEFKGTFRHGHIEWFHPKPKLKLKDDRVEKIEEKVQEKMEEQMD